MSASRRRFGGVVLVTALTVSMTVGCAGGVASAEPDRAELRQAMEELADAGVAGVQLRIHDEEGDWTGSAGVHALNGGEVSTKGRFRAGSITKSFVAVVVLQLVGEGEVALDDPITKHLPEYGFDPDITVRMLLGHTSGLFNYTGDTTADNKPDPGLPLYGKGFVANQFRTYTPDELIAVGLSKPARFEPGTDWRYSNTNFIVLGQLIERLTGTPYAAQVQSRILTPLNMKETVLPGTKNNIPGPNAHGYYAYTDAGQFHVVDVTKLNPSWGGAAGEIISTTRDLDTFIEALVGGQLVPADQLIEMKTPTLDTGYGLGLQVFDLGPTCGGPYFGHTGGIHGFSSFMFSSADGTTRLEYSVTAGAADLDDPAVAAKQQKALNDVLIAALCDGPPKDKAMLPMEAA